MKEPGRIAVFLPSLRGGGAERAMAKLANGFARRGHAVDLVLAKAEGPYLSDIAASIRVIDLTSSRVILALPSLARYLRRERPIAMLSALSHANVIALLARRISRIPVNLLISERISTVSADWVNTGLKSGTLRHLMKRTYPWADVIVTVSRDMVAGIAERLALNPDRLIAIPNPVVNRHLLSCATQPTGHPWFENQSLPVILAAGRLTKQKDLPTLIHAMAELRARGRPERLLILGEGEDRPRLEALVTELGLNDCIGLPGFAPNPYAFMSRAALFVLSSRHEGLPNALIEAMACGAPVVSTDCPTGPAEILEGDRWGKLVPVGDPQALARAMIETLGSRDRPDVRIRAADFNEDRAVSRYLEVLDLQ